MTGHDLDLDAIRSVSENGNVRANRDQVRALCAEVDSLRAKLAAVEQERDRWADWCSVQARALAAVRDWAMTNEIAAPPLDWGALGRTLAAEQDESDADIYETAAHRLANDDGRRFTLDEISREFEHEPKREQS